MDELLLSDEEIINLVTDFHFSGEGNRQILADKVAQAQLDKADQHYRQKIREVFKWLQEYAIHGGKTPLSDVLEDLRTHSPYAEFLKSEYLEGK